MIAPDTAAELNAERRFDLLAAALIGAVAILAAVLAVIQIASGQTAGRAQLQAARLTADLSARIEISSIAQDSALTMAQAALALSIAGTSREIAGLANNEEGAFAVGQTEHQASTDLASALNATSGTTGGSPLDAYTAGLLKATTQDLWNEVTEQNRQVDIANDAGTRNSASILGLSFLAPAGVLIGLGAVLREGRAGWIALSFAGFMTCAAGTLAVLAAI